MRILQCPIEIAAQMGTLSKCLQKAGHFATSFNTFHTYLGYRDYIHNVDAYEVEVVSRDAIEYFDLFHYHYGQTMLPKYADLPLIAEKRKPMVMHHWGNDVRTHDVASKNNKYVYTEDSPPAEMVHESLQQISKYIDHAIVQDYEVYPYVSSYYKYVHVLPIAFDVKSVKPVYPSEDALNPLIIHAPTNPLFKGTAFIEQAIERLRSEGHLFRYIRIEHMSNAEALDLYQQADIVVDQILCGSYGMFAVEAMSLGKPVVGYIREDLIPTYLEEPPIVPGNPDEVYDSLKQLLLQPELRSKIGRNSRRYVEKYHALDAVTKRLMDIYRQVRFQ
jgi:hypothetical protein